MWVFRDDFLPDGFGAPFDKPPSVGNAVYHLQECIPTHDMAREVIVFDTARQGEIIVVVVDALQCIDPVTNDKAVADYRAYYVLGFNTCLRHRLYSFQLDFQIFDISCQSFAVLFQFFFRQGQPFDTGCRKAVAGTVIRYVLEQGCLVG